MSKGNIDFSYLKQGIGAVAKKSIEKGLQILKKSIDEKTPEDSKELLENNKITAVIEEDGIVYGSVMNELDYAKYVEYGVGGKTYKYHKPKGTVFYKGVGARMYTRTKEEKKAEIMQEIRTNISAFIKNHK